MTSLLKLVGNKPSVDVTLNNDKKTVEDDIYPTEPDAYEIEGQIGKGAFAAVYVALCKNKNKRVAIKVIELEKDDDAEDKDKTANWDEIQKEAAIMLRMNHPNVVRCFTSFTVKSELWLILPLLEGGSCSDIMKNVKEFNQGFKDEIVIATILSDMLQGVIYCHSDGRIHRDIKAANILLSADGNAQLSDFGVSGAIIEGGLRKDGRHTFTGSLWWMAPEVLQRENRHSFPADIWSIGVTALELAYGAPPHSTQRPVKVMLTILQSPPPSFETYGDDGSKWSKKFRDFLSKCLQKDPAKRTSAKDLLNHSFIKQAKDHQYVVENVINKKPQMKMKQGDAMILPKSIAPTKPVDIKEHPSVGFDFEISGSVSHLTESLKNRIMKEDKKDDKDFDSQNVNNPQSTDNVNNSHSNSNYFNNQTTNDVSTDDVNNNKNNDNNVDNGHNYVNNDSYNGGNNEDNNSNSNNANTGQQQGQKKSRFLITAATSADDEENENDTNDESEHQDDNNDEMSPASSPNA